MTKRQTEHAARRAALPPLAVIPHTRHPNATRAEAKAAEALDAHRERTAQGRHVHVEARARPVLGAGWGEQPHRSTLNGDDPDAPARTRWKRGRGRTHNLATLPLAGPALASPVRPHDPRQWTPAKVRGVA